MTRGVLALAALLLLIAGIATAEPQPVDGGWQRSDGVPEATPTAPPPEEIAAPRVTTAACVGVGILIGLILVLMISLLRRYV